jgi:hypothetical protein
MTQTDLPGLVSQDSVDRPLLGRRVIRPELPFRGDPPLFGYIHLRELAHLPGEGTEMSVISPGLYAAWSGSRVIVFNSRQILGLATCRAPTQDPVH